MKRYSPSLSLLFIALTLSVTRTASADDFLKDFLQEATEDLSSFRDKALADHQAFRDSVLSELSEWLSQPWQPKPMEPPVPVPHDDPPVPPVVIPRDEPAPPPHNEPVRDNPVVTTPPLPEPGPPQPILPPTPPAPSPDWFTFTSYGTTYRVDASPALKAAVTAGHPGSPAQGAAKAIERLDGEQLGRLTTSLTEEARRHNLSDWAYLKMTRHFAESFIPGDTNGSRLLQGLLMVAAGYDVRFAEAQSTGRLYLLVGCRELILNQNYYILDGNHRFYPFEETPDNGVCIAPEKFGNTRLLTAQPSGKEIFAPSPGASREVKVCTHSPHCWENRCSSPEGSYKLEGNLNRMKFLSDCPIYLVPGNDYSKWNTYAKTQLSDEYEKQLYVPLKRALAGKSQLQAVNFLMKFVEAFEYKHDIDVWGVADRAFFPDETLHYPYRDCEDGAILLTRLVRDLLRLPSALVYYPGHLAAAVAFDTPVNGAYINHRGRRYTVCDPTYYYADPGMQMPSDVVDASQAVLIPLN